MFGWSRQKAKDIFSLQENYSLYFQKRIQRKEGEYDFKKYTAESVLTVLTVTINYGRTRSKRRIDTVKWLILARLYLPFSPLSLFHL